MRRLVSLVICAMLGLSACGGSSAHHVTAGPTKAAQARLARLRAALPAGFQAPGTATPASGPAVLEVAPAAGMRASDVHVAPVPAGPSLRTALAIVFNQPAPVIAHPIFVSATAVRPSQRVAVAAAHLGTAPHHAALFILQGPGYRAEHLVGVAGQVAAGYVTLPSRMAPGVWYIAAEDISGLTRNASGKLAGTALVDIGELTVP
jgi:hypothetical protein